MAAEPREGLQRAVTGRTTDQKAKYRGFKIGVICGLTAMTVVPNLGGDIARLLGQGIVALVLGCLIVGGYRGWEEYKKAPYTQTGSPPSEQPPPR